MFGFVASSIHISMDVVYDVNKKVTKEIYQVLIFGSNGFHCLVITSKYRIVREKLFKHFQDTIVTLGTIAYVANDTFHDVHVK
jgi:pterin-4a-carbinolamine dehydratase